MNPLTILVMEDEPDICRAYDEYADGLDDVSLVGMTGDANEALTLVRDHQPEAMIVDIELQRGSGSGLDVLRELNHMDLAVKPFILVATINGDGAVQNSARRYGAGYIISKKQKDYSAKTCIDFLRNLTDDIRHVYHAGPEQVAVDEAPARRRERIIKRIHTELNNVGIRNTALGYMYLTDAIRLVIDDPACDVCAEVAKLYGKTEINVFHAMQRAIDRAWSTTNVDVLLEHYKVSVRSEKGVPTVTEFVFCYADQIKSEYIS